MIAQRYALLIAYDDLRRSPVHFDLRAHFPEARGKRVNLLLLPCDGRVLFLHMAVLFEELVEQHRVYLVVAHALGFSTLVTHH